MPSAEGPLLPTVQQLQTLGGFLGVSKVWWRSDHGWRPCPGRGCTSDVLPHCKAPMGLEQISNGFLTSRCPQSVPRSVPAPTGSEWGNCKLLPYYCFTSTELEVAHGSGLLHLETGDGIKKELSLRFKGAVFSSLSLTCICISLPSSLAGEAGRCRGNG